VKSTLTVINTTYKLLSHVGIIWRPSVNVRASLSKHSHYCMSTSIFLVYEYYILHRRYEGTQELYGHSVCEKSIHFRIRSLYPHGCKTLSTHSNNTSLSSMTFPYKSSNFCDVDTAWIVTSRRWVQYLNTAIFVPSVTSCRFHWCIRWTNIKFGINNFRSWANLREKHNKISQLWCVYCWTGSII
jgi:hypothetical protein